MPIFYHVPLLHSFIRISVLRYEQYIALSELEQAVIKG